METQGNGATDSDGYLQDLLLPTPSSEAKLLAVWDDLMIESQVRVLLRLRPGYSLPDPLAGKALGSQNAYVRYLAAKRSDRDGPFKDAIQNDADPLVRYAPDESWGLPILQRPEAEQFWSFPHEKRLALARAQSGALTGQEFARYVLFAFEAKTSNTEIWDFIREYLESIPERWRRSGKS
jgi:hypothetical protein